VRECGSRGKRREMADCGGAAGVERYGDMSSYNLSTANKIGHFTLALSLVACVAGLRGVPVFVWILAYVIAAAAASTAWREKPDLSPLTWFLGIMVFWGLAGLMYWIGVRLTGSANQPWMVDLTDLLYQVEC
jgi:hypothetical protein